MKEKLLVIALVAVTGIPAFAEAESNGGWIAYPGDYGIWWGNRAQARRTTRRFSAMYSAIDFLDTVHMHLFYTGAQYLTNGPSWKSPSSPIGCTLF